MMRLNVNRVFFFFVNIKFREIKKTTLYFGHRSGEARSLPIRFSFANIHADCTTSSSNGRRTRRSTSADPILRSFPPLPEPRICPTATLKEGTITSHHTPLQYTESRPLVKHAHTPTICIVYPRFPCGAAAGAGAGAAEAGAGAAAAAADVWEGCASAMAARYMRFCCSLAWYCAQS